MKPGTVSKILWHFTGGSYCDKNGHKINNKPKPKAKAFEVLKSILSSKELRLSDYKETVKVILPEVPYYNRETKTREIKHNVERQIISSKVCCLADIPVQHLDYHSTRYGKFAIGFHRDSVIRNDFNPVFYSLQNSKIINSIYQGFTVIDDIDPDRIQSELDDIEGIVDDLDKDIKQCEKEHDIPDDIFIQKLSIEDEIRSIEETKGEIKSSIEDFVALVKTFDSSEFNTIYCEREWRSLKKFNFNYSDIAMVVLPKKYGYYEKLLKSKLLPPVIPIVPWEDLIEH